MFISPLRLFIVIACFFSLFGNARSAETPPPPSDEQMFAELLLSGSAVDQFQKELFIRLQTPVDKLHVITHSLARKDDSNAIFPASGIRVRTIKALYYGAEDKTRQGLGVDAPLTTWQGTPAQEFLITLDIDLNQAPASGEFRGSLRVRYAHGEKLLPVTLRVRQAWHIPALVLALGTLLGLWVSWYRQQGQPRDQILLQVGQIRSQLDSAADVPESLKLRLQNQLLRLQNQLDNLQIEAARKTLAHLQDIWQSWFLQQDDWKQQLEAARELEQNLSEAERAPANAAFVSALRQTVSKLRAEALVELPLTRFSEGLQAITEQWQAYAELQLQEQRLRDYKPSEELTQWKAACAELSPVAPNENEDFAAQQKDLLARMHALHKQAAELQNKLEKKPVSGDTTLRGGQAGNPLQDFDPGVSFGFVDTAGGGLPAMPNIPAMPRVRNALDWQNAGQKAQHRLRFFAWFGYSVSVLFLAGAGFSELYLNDPTFGLHLMQDYLGLFAWGFGAETARQSVTDVLQVKSDKTPANNAALAKH